MFPIKYRNNTRFLVLGFCGTIIAVLGYLIYTFNPLEFIVESMITMAPNTLMFRMWSKPPYEVLIRVYIFNVTNSEKFLTGEEKMQLVEIGPYVYQEELFNEGGVFNENGTITFKPRRQLTFRPDKSIGSPNDTIVSPNIPLLGITSHLRDASFWVNLALAQIANVLDSPSFLNLTVEEYLWGYDDRLVTLAHRALPSWINFERFGILDRLMALDNDTHNVVTINGNAESTSEDEQPYAISRFNGSPGLSQWGYNDALTNNSICNTLKGGYVEGIFPKNMNPNITIRLYRRAFCRPVNFKFEEYGEVAGYETLNFRVDPKFLARPEENPENACYCVNGICPKKGVSFLSPCYYGIPITISQPHFYNADPELLDQIQGLVPDRDKHDTTFKLQRRIGIPLNAKLRIQINLNVDTTMSLRCKPFNGLTLPLFWLEMDIEELPGIIVVALALVEKVLPITQLVLMWCCMLFGCAMVAAAALFTIYSPVNYGLEDPFANSVAYSPIRIIPMTPAIRINK